MGIAASVLYVALYLFYLALIVRIALEMIQGYSRHFRPRGFTLVVCEGVYTVTDPPVKALRKVMPPLRLGAVALDVSIMVVFVLCTIIMMLLVPFVI